MRKWRCLIAAQFKITGCGDRRAAPAALGRAIRGRSVNGGIGK